MSAGDWTPENLSRAFLAIADDHGHGLPRTMVEALRLGAGRMLDLAELEARAVADAPFDEPGRCRGCGAPLEVRHRGRRRLWCGDGRCARKREKHRIAATEGDHAA
ncbi:MAG: hypothetical protein M0T75_08530 [Chloroflexi bacterium]|nr:hypothetical protein [Chloroflexota bacterium]